jgi:hypothetical protein
MVVRLGSLVGCQAEWATFLTQGGPRGATWRNVADFDRIKIKLINPWKA